MESPPTDADPRIPWFGPWEKISGVTINERTGFNESKHDPDELLAGLFYRNGDSKRRVYSPPAVWRVLEVGETNVYDVPCCPGCGTAFVETGRYGILVQFSANCAARHDPEPPPKRAEPSREDQRLLDDLSSKLRATVSWLDFKRTMDEGRAYARKMMTVDAAHDIEEYLAWRLGIHHADFVAARQQATEALIRQIAPLVKNLPHPLRPPSVGLKRGDPIPACPACGAPFEKEWDPPFKSEMIYYAPACYWSVLHPEMATR